MRDDYWMFPVAVLIFAVGLAVFVWGYNEGINNADNKCMQYHKAMPLQDVEPLCKQIVRGK